VIKEINRSTAPLYSETKNMKATQRVYNSRCRQRRL